MVKVLRPFRSVIEMVSTCWNDACGVPQWIARGWAISGLVGMDGTRAMEPGLWAILRHVRVTCGLMTTIAILRFRDKELGFRSGSGSGSGPSPGVWIEGRADRERGGERERERAT